ncbi:MAG: hypothetical protein JXR34_00385 [Bacteroidales bacterium]|nr:hypothetical protein [Bacteroidales bacterium]
MVKVELFMLKKMASFVNDLSIFAKKQEDGYVVYIEFPSGENAVLIVHNTRTPKVYKTFGTLEKEMSSLGFKQILVVLS